MRLKKVEMNAPCPCGSGKTFADCCSVEVLKQLSKQSERANFPRPEYFKFDLAGYTNRIVWNKIHSRPKDETFHAFIVNVLKWTVGKKWYEAQVAMPATERHVIMKWVYAWHELMEKIQPLNLSPTDRIMPTGDVRELMALASDVYHLQLVHELPRRLTDRLRSYDQFQGARYEVAVAGSLVRSGFEIEWIEEKAKKHHEFNAKHKVTQEVIAVETKSRHRSGTLHQKGEVPDFTKMNADISSLYNQALQQAPGDKPFAVFIDINLPHEAELPLPERQWIASLMELQKQNKIIPNNTNSPCTLLAITNSGWHYEGQGIASQGEYVLLMPTQAIHPLGNPLTVQAVQRSLATFGEIPEDE
jgi:SEC-C motif